MKTSFKFKINALEIEIGGKIVKTPEIDIASEVDTTIGELRGLYELQKQVLDESPALIEKFTKAFLKSATNLQDEFDAATEKNKESEAPKPANPIFQATAPKLPEQAQHTILNKWYEKIKDTHDLETIVAVASNGEMEASDFPKLSLKGKRTFRSFVEDFLNCIKSEK